MCMSKEDLENLQEAAIDPRDKNDAIKKYRDCDYAFGMALRNKIAEIGDTYDPTDYEKWDTESGHPVYEGIVWSELALVARGLREVIDVLFTHNLITECDDSEGAVEPDMDYYQEYKE